MPRFSHDFAVFDKKIWVPNVPFPPHSPPPSPLQGSMSHQNGSPAGLDAGSCWWNLREPPRNKPNRSLRRGHLHVQLEFTWTYFKHIIYIYIYPYIHWHSDWNGKSISKLAGKLTCGKSPCVMSKSTISIDSMAMFNSFFYVYQRVHPINIPLNHDFYPIKSL